MGGTLFILFLLIMVACCIHSCCFSGTLCQTFLSWIFGLCCGRCDGCATMVGRRDAAGFKMNDEDCYEVVSGSAATQWRHNGKSSTLPLCDTGCALPNLPSNRPILVQTVNGATHALSMPEQSSNPVTASAIVSGAPQTFRNNGLESTNNGRRMSMVLFGNGRITPAPSLPCL